MAAPPLTRDSLGLYTQRLRSIGSESTRRWGALTAADMLRHLTCSFEISLAKVDTPDVGNIFTKTVLRWAAFHLPWPKGKIKVPDIVTPPAEEDLRGEYESLLSSMEEFLCALETSPDRQSRSLAFGRLDLRAWSRLHGRHLDHHLRQFGC